MTNQKEKNEKLLKLGAWLAFLVQALNALIALINNVPQIATNNPVELVSNGQGKSLALQSAIAIGFGLLQSILPRLQNNKSK